jgi:iron complex transport system ATP-binding protein
LNDVRPDPAAAPSTGPVLEALGLRYRHPGASSDLFDGVSLGLSAGRFVGLIGPNGSGKTTLVRLLGGLLRPAAGEVRLEGRPMSALPPRARARRIAVVLQESTLLFNFSVLEVVLMGRAPRLGLLGLEGPDDFAAARSALRDVDLLGREGRPIQELSSGERQRALIARALAQEPRVLLMDEPTAFLDMKHALAIYEILSRLSREQGLLVLAVSHDLNLAARHAERLLLLHLGRLVADGPPDQVLTRERIREVYETEAEVARDPVSGAPLVLPKGPRR